MAPWCVIVEYTRTAVGKSNGRQTTESILTPTSFEIAEHTEVLIRSADFETFEIRQDCMRTLRLSL